MFSLRSVCLSVCSCVCLSVRWIIENLWTDFDEISWRGRAWPKDQWVQFWWRSGSPSGSRSPKSGFTGFWRSAEVCTLWVLLVDIYITLQVSLTLYRVRIRAENIQLGRLRQEISRWRIPCSYWRKLPSESRQSSLQRTRALFAYVRIWQQRICTKPTPNISSLKSGVRRIS